MAVSEVRAVGFTDADVARFLGDPDRIGPRGGRRYNRSRAALVVACHPHLLNSYAGRHGWWASLKLLAEGWAVPVPYDETVIVPRTDVAASQQIEVYGSAPAVVLERLCVYEGLTLVRAELAPPPVPPVPPVKHLTALTRPDPSLQGRALGDLAQACARYAAAVLEIAPDLYSDAEVAAAAEHSRVYSEIAGACSRPDQPGVAEALELVHGLAAADTTSLARATRTLALAHAARRA